jgi:protein SCO1/2
MVTSPNKSLRIAALAAPGAVALLLLTSCGGDSPRPGELHGAVLSAPITKADFTLTNTAGEPFAFRAETEGFVTLLFFGYTSCPDICPVHMANIAAVLRKVPPQTASRVKVVMVTVDPERDTPERLRNWLNAFDPSFVGLTGSMDEVNEILRSLMLAPAMKGEGETDYLVGHTARVIAFTTDNRAHVTYPSGTRQVVWAHDLPLLVEADWRNR